MVRESLEPGHSVSVVARCHGINPNQLFHWRKLWQPEPEVNVNRVYRVMRDHDLLLEKRRKQPVWFVVMKVEWQWARVIPVGARTVLGFVVTMAPSCV